MRIPSVDRDGEGPRVGVAAMVDIAFLLLVFFLVATTIMPRESDLLLKLPTPPDGVVESPPLPILLELDEQGTVWWGEGAGRMAVPDDGREMAGLVELLKPVVAWTKAGGDGEPPVMLKVADGARQQRFIDLLNALAGCGVGMVGMIE